MRSGRSWTITSRKHIVDSWKRILPWWQHSAMTPSRKLIENFACRFVPPFFSYNQFPYFLMDLSPVWSLLFVMGSVCVGRNSKTCHHIQIVFSPSTCILSDQTCLLYVYLCRSVSWTTITYGGPDLGGLVNACGQGLDTLLDSSMLPLPLHRSILTRHRPSLVREGKTWGWSSVLQHGTRWSSHGLIMTWHGLPTQFSSISVCWVPLLSLSSLL